MGGERKVARNEVAREKVANGVTKEVEASEDGDKKGNASVSRWVRTIVILKGKR